MNEVMGDCYYDLNDAENARRSYKISIGNLQNEMNFGYAWSNYRMGLLSENPAYALKYFETSGRIFDSLGDYKGVLARSEGERGIASVQLKRYLEFVKIAEWMCGHYYNKGEQSFAPAVTVVTAQLVRLMYVLEGRPLPADNSGSIYPDFKRGVV